MSDVSIDDIVSNETVMQAIGSYDYASDTLTADATWNEAIANSAYIESVLNVKVPAMTSYNTPSGVVFANPSDTSYPPYYAFDKNTSTQWMPADVGATRIGYQFESEKKICAFKFLRYSWSGYESYGFTNCSVQKSTDGGSTFVDVTTPETMYLIANTSGQYITRTFTPTTADRWAFALTSPSAVRARAVELQFYGREEGGIQSWLRAAGITNKVYTTISELASDSTTLLALISSHDATDYLVTAKGLINDVCGNSTIMSYIGLDNYCSNTLIADADWIDGICNSAYVDSVMNIKVPNMTSNTTPSGEVIADYQEYPNVSWHAFDGDSSTFWYGTANAHRLGYKFDRAVKCVYVKQTDYNTTAGVVHWKAQVSDDGTNWTDVTDLYPCVATNNTQGHIMNTNNTYLYYSVYMPETYGIGMKMLQFYGREDV